MSEIENAVKSEETTEKWMVGCAVCDEGLCEKIDELITEKKLKQSQAIRVVTDLANEKVGADFFKISTIKHKYYRMKGIMDEPPKKKPVKKVELSTKKVPDVQESPQKSTDVQEPVEPPIDTNVEDLPVILVDSLKAMIVGLQSFNNEDELTQNEDIKQELAICLVEIIPEAKMALNRINKGE